MKLQWLRLAAFTFLSSVDKSIFLTTIQYELRRVDIFIFLRRIVNFSAGDKCLLLWESSSAASDVEYTYRAFFDFPTDDHDIAFIYCDISIKRGITYLPRKSVDISKYLRTRTYYIAGFFPMITANNFKITRQNLPGKNRY